MQTELQNRTDTEKIHIDTENILSKADRMYKYEDYSIGEYSYVANRNKHENLALAELLQNLILSTYTNSPHKSRSQANIIVNLEYAGMMTIQTDDLLVVSKGNEILGFASGMLIPHLPDTPLFYVPGSSRQIFFSCSSTQRPARHHNTRLYPWQAGPISITQ